MSGPAIHHIIAHETVKKMQAGASPEELNFLKKAGTEFAPFLHFGCQGPDPLFFNMKDWDEKGAKYAKMVLEVLAFMENLKQEIKDAIPPEVIATAEAIAEKGKDSALLSELAEQLVEVKHTLELLSAMLQTGVKEYLTDTVNVFDKLLTHPIQDKGKYDPGTWWWFDTLHYRRSGQYAFQLLKNAKPNSNQMAYALGYLTHFAADTVGHPFVNIISGGPYRTHAQRHKVIENHHDVYAWRKHFSQEFVQSNVAEKYRIGTGLGNLPEDFINYLLKTIKDVYQSDGLKYGKPMEAKDLNDAYRLWLKWFTSATNVLDLPEPVPYSLTKEIEEALEQFKKNFSGAWEDVTSPGKGKGSIWDIIKSIAKAVLGVVEMAAALVDFLLASAAIIGAAAIRYLISMIYQALYDAFHKFYQGVVLNGLAFPFNKNLDHFATSHMVKPSSKDPTGVDASKFSSLMPLKKFNINLIDPETNLVYEKHLVYPRPLTDKEDDPAIEKSKTTVAPFQYFEKEADPFLYINGSLKLEPQFYEYIKNFTETTGEKGISADKEANFSHLSTRARSGPLGNAVDFSNFLFSEFKKGKVFPDFNLDGDRGYGFPCWRRVKGASSFNNKNVMHVAVEETTDVASHNVLNTEIDIIHPNKDIL